ncbi:uncharacterized protein LOC136092007 [Hydra vulgaris]|uniref:Uncharacterized protein LOC136092007 n=1 Tax=Hydra vulgaris TaxID=6087 RepID=A0ABM4DMM9_HYDVU
MEYCCHTWDRSFNNALSLLDKVQKRIVNIVGPALAANLPPLSHRCNAVSLSLFSKSIMGIALKKLAPLVSSTKIHSRVTGHSVKSHPFSVAVLESSKNSNSSSFFPRPSVLWNSLPSFCCPASYYLKSFKSSVNHYLAL